MRTDVLRICVQRSTSSVHRARTVVEVEQLGHAGQRVCVLRVDPQRIGERCACVGAVVFLQEQPAELDARAFVARIGRNRLVESPQCILEQLRVTLPEMLYRYADRDQLTGRELAAAVVTVDECIEELERLIGTPCFVRGECLLQARLQAVRRSERALHRCRPAVLRDARRGRDGERNADDEGAHQSFCSAARMRRSTVASCSNSFSSSLSYCSAGMVLFFALCAAMFCSIAVRSANNRCTAGSDAFALGARSTNPPAFPPVRTAASVAMRLFCL